MATGSTDPSPPPRSVNLSGCMPSSPSSSWHPAGSRHRGGGGGGTTVVRRLQLDVIGWWCGHHAWRKLLRRLAQETRCICSSPTAASRPITFGYDAASYAKNFDDGRRPAHYAAPAVAVVANAADKSTGR